VHPAVLDTYLEQKTIDGLKRTTEEALERKMSIFAQSEAAIFKFLKSRYEKSCLIASATATRGVALLLVGTFATVIVASLEAGVADFSGDFFVEGQTSAKAGFLLCR